MINGRQTEHSRYSIQGQKKYFADNNLPETDNGWFLVPGRIDKQSYWLLVFFVASLVALFLFNYLI
jgi:SSS family solute:Na+ symporter